MDVSCWSLEAVDHFGLVTHVTAWSSSLWLVTHVPVYCSVALLRPTYMAGSAVGGGVGVTGSTKVLWMRWEAAIKWSGRHVWSTGVTRCGRILGQGTGVVCTAQHAGITCCPVKGSPCSRSCSSLCAVRAPLLVTSIRAYGWCSLLWPLGAVLC
jgi:hypothetical protein